MKKQTLFNKVKDLIAGLSFRLFLWASSLTEDEYLKEIYRQEYNRINVTPDKQNDGV